MDESQLHSAFIHVGRTLGFVATHHEQGSINLARLRHAVADEPEVFRTPTSVVAYLQAPTGWRQRVILTVLLRVDHPLSALVNPPTPPSGASAKQPQTLRSARWPGGPAGDEVRQHLSALVKSGLPMVVEKCITDHINLDELSPRMVGPFGVQVVQRQTLRVRNTLAVWMREHTLSPRGTPSLLRDAEREGGHLPTLAESAPIFAY